jgi:allophanate hydrolase
MTNPQQNALSMRLDITTLQTAYRSGQTTPEQVVRECLSQIRASSDSNAWIYVLNEQELAPYLDALKSKRPEDSPLWGIPFAIKDNIDLANIPTTAACPAYSFTPDRHAFVVQRLIDAGAIPLGKTNLDQFATGLVGTRSPYGEVPNAYLPDYVSGGSSSGSAWAVAKGQVSFALGTDTAGSGRVPAAFNNLVGCKPTKGRLSIHGVVPACKSLDCITIFAKSLAETQTILNVASAENPEDPFSRNKLPIKGLASSHVRIGVPRAEQLEFFGNEDYARLFDDACKHLQNSGATLIEIDFMPFLAAAKLLYQGPWVAERYAAVGQFIHTNPEAALPVIRDIILPGISHTAVDAYNGYYSLQALKREADRELQQVDAIIIPTAGTCYTRAQIAQDPIKLNANLGTYTNFMNLLDYAALAVPAGFTPAGLPFGVTLFAPAFCDERLLTIASLMGDKASPLPAPGPGYITVAVCGAHLQGMPLNWQLAQRGAVFLESVRSAPRYRFYALAGGPPARPGMVRVSEGGAAIAMELWAVPQEHFGSFVAGIPAPLGIGKVETHDGRWVCGFICEAIGVEGARDITDLADWRVFINTAH